MENLGKNIKRIRIEKEMTLKDLSDRSNVSKSQLSQIERNNSVPTVTKLLDIAKALGVTLSALLPELASHIGPSPATRETRTDNDTERLSAYKKISIVRKSARKTLVMPWGAAYEMLCPDLQNKIEFILLHYPPGARVKEPYAHQGEECGLVLEGWFKGTFGDEVVILEPGDSICYDSEIPHVWEVAGKGAVRAVWAITPPSF